MSNDTALLHPEKELLHLGDELDLAEDVLGKGLDRDAGAGGLAGEVLAIDGVEGAEVAHVGQEADGLDDVLETEAVLLQQSLQVAADAVSLGLDGGAFDLAGLRDDGDLAGGEQEAVGGNGLGLGADGGRSLGSGSNFHDAFPFCD